MLYLFHGSDVDKVRTKAFEWVAKARAKEPNLVYVRLAREELTDATLEDAASSGGLFVQRLLILIDDPFQGARDTNDETEYVVRPASDVGRTTSYTSDLIEEYLDALVASDNAIVILAPKLPAAKAKKFVVKAKVEYKFDLPAGKAGAPERGFNANLVNALAAKSREQLWLEINRALRAGDPPEMLHGLLHWKARSIMEGASAGRRSAWKPHESRQLSLALISLLQDSRRKGLDLSESLERFALTV